MEILELKSTKFEIHPLGGFNSQLEVAEGLAKFKNRLREII